MAKKIRTPNAKLYPKYIQWKVDADERFLTELKKDPEAEFWYARFLDEFYAADLRLAPALHDRAAHYAGQGGLCNMKNAAARDVYGRSDVGGLLYDIPRPPTTQDSVRKEHIRVLSEGIYDPHAPRRPDVRPTPDYQQTAEYKQERERWRAEVDSAKKDGAQKSNKYLAQAQTQYRRFKSIAGEDIE